MNPILQRIRTQSPCMLEGPLLHMLREVNPQAKEHPQLAEWRDKLRPKAEVDSDGIATIRVYGALATRPHPYEMAYFGIEDYEQVRAAIGDAENDNKCKALVLDFDSPGGFVTGCAETSDRIRSCGKPVVAYAGTLMASAAYWMGSQAKAVVVARSGEVGSIGVYSMLIDDSRLWENMGIHVELIRNREATDKVPGIEGGALRMQERESYQAGVQELFEMFKADVMAGRPSVSPAALTGKCFIGQKAVDAGLADYVGDLSYAKRLALQSAG